MHRKWSNNLQKPQKGKNSHRHRSCKRKLFGRKSKLQLFDLFLHNLEFQIGFKSLTWPMSMSDISLPLRLLEAFRRFTNPFILYARFHLFQGLKIVSISILSAISSLPMPSFILLAMERSYCKWRLLA